MSKPNLTARPALSLAKETVKSLAVRTSVQTGMLGPTLQCVQNSVNGNTCTCLTAQTTSGRH